MKIPIEASNLNSRTSLSDTLSVLSCLIATDIPLQVPKWTVPYDPLPISFINVISSGWIPCKQINK